MKKELEDYLQKEMDKYFDLVWYARSKPAHDYEFWAGTTAEIKHGALNAQARVEEKYMDEINDLRGEHGDWHHGFNSGMLACIRFVMTAEHPYLIEDDEFGGEAIWAGGLEDAIEEFPMLDT